MQITMIKDLHRIIQLYTTDFNAHQLQVQLQVFSATFSRETGKKVVISFLQSTSQAQRYLLSEVSKVVRLLLVMPASNATSERSFSCLRRIQTYLRSTMTQS